MSEVAETTPLMKQYNEQKALAQDSLLLFRMGDFYELFGEDAVQASKILNIVLTSRDKNKENAMPMAGVPAHSIAGYIQKLLKAGRKVSICEQLEDPAEKVGKGIVKREIIRTLTPALQFESSETDHHFLAAVSKSALALLDVSTGDVFYKSALSENEITRQIERYRPKHILWTEATQILAESLPPSLAETLPSNYLHETEISQLFKDFFGVAQGLSDSPGEKVIATLLKYGVRTQNLVKGQTQLRLPRPLETPGRMRLGTQASEHLDLFNDDLTQKSLFGFLKRTRTAMGTRALRRTMQEPLFDPRDILHRQEILKRLALHPDQKVHQAHLDAIYDLERILSRIQTGLASPKDTLGLGQSLKAFESLQSLFSEFTQLKNSLELQPLSERILTQQREDAPHLSRDGGIFKRGFNADLDELLELNENGEAWMARYETEQRAATGIATLKVRYNRVFGYYIEISQGQAQNAPPHYQRKQTMVGAERFFTEELKIFEDKLISAQSRLKKLELALFQELILEIRKHSADIMRASEIIAEFDVLQSLSQLVLKKNYTFPKIEDGIELDIQEGRHPLLDSDSFISNASVLHPHPQMIITGPNMGGKSTYMRQVALIVILGQMGCPVPAQSARWGSVSSILTRIGAKDAIARGQSTFMVEMNELASILNEADQKSLLILDEIGRGTSTFDGISVAWASLEWIAKSLKCRTLFATHYHELTKLSIGGVFNSHMAVEGSKAKSLRFLFEVKPGPANESFGIQVAQLAGMPRAVIQRAWQVLEFLEKGELPGVVSDSAQLSFFAQPEPTVVSEYSAISEAKDSEAAEIVRELKSIDIDSTSPMMALKLLASMQQKLRESAELI